MGQSLSRNPNLSLSLSAVGRGKLRRREGLRPAHDDPAGNFAFEDAVRSAERAVQRQVSHQALTQAQFDALVSYTFNLGAGGAMLVLRRIDAGDLDGAAESMLRNPGPAARRQEESAPFRA